MKANLAENSKTGRASSVLGAEQFLAFKPGGAVTKNAPVNAGIVPDLRLNLKAVPRRTVALSAVFSNIYNFQIRIGMITYR
jgi:hypothetical protein